MLERLRRRWRRQLDARPVGRIDALERRVAIERSYFGGLTHLHIARVLGPTEA